MTHDTSLNSMTASHEEAHRRLVIPPRYNGPADSANGGYASGLLAAELLGEGNGTGSVAAAAPAVRVRLQAPPPLGEPLTVVTAPGHSVRLLHDTTLIAEAVAVVGDTEPQHQVAGVSLAAARAAEARFRGVAQHPFPTCFACGTDRGDTEGLNLRPGPLVEDPGRTACAWTPAQPLADPTHPERATTAAVWAALDCPSGWTSDIVGRPMVLGQMTTRIWRRPRIGVTHLLTGQQLAVEGRKVRTATTLYAEHGEVMALAEHVWIILRQTQESS